MTSSKTLKKIVSIGAALMLALIGNAVPAHAAQFTVTYSNTLNNTTSAPAAEQTDANGQLTVNNTQLTHNNNTFIFLGWSQYDFNGFPAGSSPTIYGTSSVANSASLTATGNMTLKAAWSQPITQLQMSNPTEIPIWYSSVYNLDSASPLPSDFTVTVDGSPVTVASFTGNKIVLATALTSIQQQVRVSWTPAIGRRLVSDSSFGYVIPGFTNVSVTTNSIQFPPTLSNASASSTTHEGTTVSFSSNFNGDLRYVVKSSTSSAPASAQNLADGTYGSDVVVSSGSFAGTTSTGTRTLMIYGLSASTSYKIWLAGKNNQFNTYSNMVEVSFTTTAPPAAPTFTGTPNVGETLTASVSGSWYYCANPHSSGSLAIECMPIFGMMGFLTGSAITVPATSAGVIQVSLVGKYITVAANGQAAATQLVGAGSGSNNNQNNNQNNNFTPPPSCAGQSALTNVSVSPSRITRTGTYQLIFNDNPTLNGCGLPYVAAAQGTYVNGTLLGSVSGYGNISFTANTSARSLSSIETRLGRQLVVGDVITFKYWIGISNPLQVSGVTPTYAPSLTIIAEAVTSTDSTDVTDITEDQRPLPVWASNIVSSIPTLTKSLVTTGGSVALTGGDYADLKSVTIGGKAVAFKIETTGHVNIPVPAGEAGKTADIVIVFGGGTMTVQDGIKYVAQVEVAKVAERPIAIAAGAKKITEAIADQIRQAAFANPKNTHIQCVAYAANSSAKAQAAAKLTAVQACGIAAKANPALKISEVSVIVNKAKARQSAVGIKVYKQN